MNISYIFALHSYHEKSLSIWISKYWASSPFELLQYSTATYFWPNNRNSSPILREIVCHLFSLHSSGSGIQRRILRVTLLAMIPTKLWRGVRLSTTSIAAVGQVLIGPVSHCTLNFEEISLCDDQISSFVLSHCSISNHCDFIIAAYIQNSIFGLQSQLFPTKFL